MHLQTCLKIGGALLMTGLLAACGGSKGSSNNNTSPTSSFESKFGSEFAKIYDASSTSQPVIPDSSAVPALQPAGQPIAVPG